MAKAKTTKTRRRIHFKKFKKFSKKKGFYNFMGPHLSAKYEVEYPVSLHFNAANDTGDYLINAATSINIMGDLIINQDFISQRQIYQLVKLTGISAFFSRSIVYTGWNLQAAMGTTTVLTMPAASFSMDLNPYAGSTSNWKYLQRQYRISFINEDSAPTSFYWKFPSTIPNNPGGGLNPNFLGSSVWSDSVNFGGSSRLYLNIGSTQRPQLTQAVLAGTDIPMGVLRLVFYIKWCKNTGG